MFDWLKTVLITVALGGNSLVIAADPTSVHAHGVHGMVLFGEPGRVFASHLPLYRPPHNWQVVLELEPAATAGQQLTDELLAKGGLLSLEPEPFDLFRLKPGAAEPLTAFIATLYRDHFERGGEKLVQLTWRVKKTWVFEPVVLAATPSHDYFVIGQGLGTQWLLHKVQGRPDVDQLLAIQTHSSLPTTITVPNLISVASPALGIDHVKILWQDSDDLQ